MLKKGAVLSVHARVKNTFAAVLVGFVLIGACGCGFMQPAKKPEGGPAGAPPEAKPNPPVAQRFEAAPVQLYDLEAIAGTVFDGLNKEDWSKARAGLANLQSVWQQAKEAAGEKKGVKEADAAIIKLAGSVSEQKITASHENLNKFMASVADIGKSYKLSPIADIITVGNAVRNVSFYVEDKNWSKAASKVKALEDTWNQVKPSMEQFGILGEVTATHSHVKQIKDAVNAENKGGVEEQVAGLNESMGKIREYYRGK